MFYPTKGLCESRTQWGPFDILSILLRLRKGCLTLSNYRRKFAFLKSWECFIPWGTLQSRAQWGPFDSFNFIVVWKGCLTLSIYWLKFSFLKSWKCFIPRMDSAKQNPNGARLILSILLCLGKGVCYFKFTVGNSPFWNLENLLSPEGTLRKQNPCGVHLRVFPFYCGLGKGFGTFKTCLEERPFWKPENVLLYGWDGVGWGGR